MVKNGFKYIIIRILCGICHIIEMQKIFDYFFARDLTYVKIPAIIQTEQIIQIIQILTKGVRECRQDLRENRTFILK